MNEEIEKLQQNISESNEIKPHIIDVNLIESQSGKVINLLKGNTEILNNQYYNFKFKEPIYIHKIIFVPEDGVDLLGMSIISINFKDEESITTFTKKEQQIVLPKKVIKEFKIKPKKKFLQKTRLNKIELTGFLVDELSSIKEKVEEIDDYKANLQKKLNTLIEQNNDYNAKEDRIKELDGLIPNLEKNKKALDDEVNNLEIQRKSLKEDKKILEDSTSQLEEKSNTLNEEIPRLEQEIRKLTADKNIFSTEMAEYIKQANNHIKIYFTLSLIPWLLIACISYLVFNGTADLSTVYNALDGEIDVFAIFWTRLPFALITISILFVSYEISKVFVQNMMKIQSQKRVFAKVGIVAKDVADSSILGLEDLKDSEKFELRTKLKMDLLKAHLSNNIGENYEYNIKTSLLEYLKNRGK